MSLAGCARTTRSFEGEGKRMGYRCVTTSIEGFVQQLAVAYITHGYWFYVAGEIPWSKDPAAVDAKLIDRYGIAISKWARCRRKKQGMANMQYLRHERFFVLIATRGTHKFFHCECMSIRDIRNVPLKFAGYTIGCRKGNDGQWHASVRLNQERHSGLKAMLAADGLRRNRSAMLTRVTETYQPLFAPIRRQCNEAWIAINRGRKRAGLGKLESVSGTARRRIVLPFGPRGES